MTNNPAAQETSRQFSTDERKKAAGKGQAMKGGSFPIKNAQDLKNAIQAYGRAKDKAAAKRHIISRAKALGLSNLLPDGWDTAMATAKLTCTHEDCARSFLDAAALDEHASAVHTFEDTRQLVSEALREKYGVGINGASKVPYEQRTYVYVRDIAEDWVVYDEESGGMSKSVMKKVGYALDDKGQVAFVGEPVEVVRKTVYEAKPVVGA